MLEKDIEKKLGEGLQKICRKAKCLKFISPGCAGVPDRIILLPGAKVAFVELKAPKKKERALQIYRQGLLKALGFTVFSTVNSVEKVNDVLLWCKKEVES